MRRPSRRRRSSPRRWIRCDPGCSTSRPPRQSRSPSRHRRRPAGRETCRPSVRGSPDAPTRPRTLRPSCQWISVALPLTRRGRGWSPALPSRSSVASRPSGSSPLPEPENPRRPRRRRQQPRPCGRRRPNTRRRLPRRPNACGCCSRSGPPRPGAASSPSSGSWLPRQRPALPKPVPSRPPAGPRSSRVSPRQTWAIRLPQRQLWPLRPRPSRGSSRRHATPRRCGRMPGRPNRRQRRPRPPRWSLRPRRLVRLRPPLLRHPLLRRQTLPQRLLRAAVHGLAPWSVWACSPQRSSS